MIIGYADKFYAIPPEMEEFIRALGFKNEPFINGPVSNDINSLLSALGIERLTKFAYFQREKRLLYPAQLGFSPLPIDSVQALNLLTECPRESRSVNIASSRLSEVVETYISIATFNRFFLSYGLALPDKFTITGDGIIVDKIIFPFFYG